MSRVQLSPDDARALLLELLDGIDAFCQEHGLDYYLYAGTLIGAVRHRGFIPWDDDIDIMMERHDYERFCRVFPTDGPVHLVSSASHRSYPYAYAKVCLAGTVVEEDVVMDRGDMFGLNVDVIPVDSVPRAAWLYRAQVRLALLVRAVLLAKVVRPTPDLPCATRIGLRLAQWLLKPVPTHWLTAARTRVATLAARRDTGHVGMLVASVPWRVPISWLAPSSAMEFEGRIWPGPADAYGLLSRVYGDFMTLPPPERRVPPHRSVAFRLIPSSEEEL